jgi:poly(3-hydroxybutyrate) depolymerase
MILNRYVHSMVAVLAILGTACSSSSSPSSGGGGSQGSGGVSSQGGTTASGGRSGTGGLDGTGGVPSQGGSQRETMGSGGTTQPGTGGVNGTGGRTGPGSGGAGTGGRLGSGGAGIGGAATGTGGTLPGASGGSGALGGASSSGSGGASGAGSGGVTGPGSGGTSGGSGVDAGVAQSAGCGKTKTLQNGTITITSGGASRKYILLVPSSYDNSHPYRLVFAFAESGSSAQSVADRKYFTMQTQDTKNTTIFAAPDAVGSAGSWSKSDADFTDAILAQLEGDLCVDTTRVFATGFSFGGGMAMALACIRADVFRGVAFFSGADLTGSCPTTLTKPIAYYASQASEDANGMDITNPMTGEKKQAQFAAVNGCTAEPASTTFPAAGQPHTCTIYKGCSAGHPTEYCVFNGGHGWEPKDPGQTTSWDAPEAWKFITQF